MRVRFGYVAIAMRLDKVTSSSPVTYKKYSSIESERERGCLKIDDPLN